MAIFGYLLEQSLEIDLEIFIKFCSNFDHWKAFKKLDFSTFNVF